MRLDISYDPDSLLADSASLPFPASAHTRTTTLPSSSRRSRSWINSLFKSPRSAVPQPSPTLPDQPAIPNSLKKRSWRGTLSGGETIQVRVGSWAGAGPQTNAKAAGGLQVSAVAPLVRSPSSSTGSYDSPASPTSRAPSTPRSDASIMDLPYWDRELAQVQSAYKNASLNEQASFPTRRKRSSSHLSVGAGARRSVSEPIPSTFIEQEDSLPSLGKVWDSFLEEAADLTFDEAFTFTPPPSPSSTPTSPAHSFHPFLPSHQHSSPSSFTLSSFSSNPPTVAPSNVDWDSAVSRSSSAFSLAAFPSPPLSTSNVTSSDSITRPLPPASIAERRARVVPALVIRHPVPYDEESQPSTATSSASVLSYASTSSAGARHHLCFSPIEDSPPLSCNPAAWDLTASPPISSSGLHFPISSNHSPPPSSTFSDASFPAFLSYQGSLDTDDSSVEGDDDSSDAIWGLSFGTTPSWCEEEGEDGEQESMDLTIRVEGWTEEASEKGFEEQGVIEYGVAF